MDREAHTENHSRRNVHTKATSKETDKRRLRYVGHGNWNKYTCDDCRQLFKGEVEGKTGKGRPLITYIENLKNSSGLGSCKWLIVDRRDRV